MKVNDQFEAEVTSLAPDGQGRLEIQQDFPIYVPGVWPGDRGRFEIIHSEKRFASARLVSLIRPSPDRVEKIPCAHQGEEIGKCGGCPWMMASYEAQLHQKQLAVIKGFEQLALAKSDNRVSPIWPSPKTLGYRRVAQLRTDGKKLGYCSPNSNSIAPIRDCPILTDKNRKTLKTLIKALPKPEWVPGPGEKWNQIEIDESNTGIALNLERPFQQANGEQNERMKGWLLDKLKIHPKDSPILELFCGTGNFTEVIVASGYQNIVGVDTLGVENRLRLPHLRSLLMDVLTPKTWPIIRQAITPKILILDPPRGGFQGLSKFLEIFSDVKEIYYISCRLTSLIRDLKNLDRKDWEIVEVQPVDAFPQTPHIEALIHLRKS